MDVMEDLENRIPELYLTKTSKFLTGIFTYKLQLQQVEAALTTDPDNEVQFQYLSAEHLFVISILGASNTQK